MVTTPPGAEKPPVLPPALAATRWHGMTIGHGFCPMRLADGARQHLVAEPFGDFAIGQRLARRDLAHDGIDTGVEFRRLASSMATSVRSRASPRSSADDAVHGAPHSRRSVPSCAAGKRRKHPRTRGSLARFGKLHADNAARRPNDAAAADGRVEQCECEFRHDAANLARGVRRRRPIPDRPSWRCAAAWGSAARGRRRRRRPAHALRPADPRRASPADAA